MKSNWFRFLVTVVSLGTLSSLIAYQSDSQPIRPLIDPFAAGWMLSDTNADGIVDFVSGNIVVPANPSAWENAAAADFAARLGFATTGFTLPLVIHSAEDRANGPRIYIGRNAAPARYSAAVTEIWNRLGPDE
jgi:hypothetical protein